MQAVNPKDVSSRGLRLLNVASSVDPAVGDVSEAILGLSRALLDLGHEVETVSVDDPQSDWARALPVPVQLKGPAHGQLEYSWGFHRWLLDNAARFDAILAHGLWRYNSRASRRAARVAQRPYFVFPHGMLDPWFRRQHRVRHLGKFAYWWLTEEAVLRDAAAVLFSSEAEMQQARKSFSPYRCVERIVPLGAAGPPPKTEEQRRAFAGQFPELAGKRVLLFAGCLDEKNGCDLLLRAFLIVLQAQPKEARYDVHLMLAGLAQPEYLSALQQLAAKCDEVSPGSVSFAGVLSGDLKWGALRTAEALILPSHQENFSMAVAEALACGTPVLLSRAVNLWREIESGGAALVESDTVGGCAQLLGRWLGQTPGERNAMAASALACFREKFEITQAAQRLAATVREFLPKAASGSVSAP
jgi:glycosyltransferase involved in cell wall biosynthesis